MHCDKRGALLWRLWSAHVPTRGLPATELTDPERALALDPAATALHMISPADPVASASVHLPVDLRPATTRLSPASRPLHAFSYPLSHVLTLDLIHHGNMMFASSALTPRPTPAKSSRKRTLPAEDDKLSIAATSTSTNKNNPTTQAGPTFPRPFTRPTSREAAFRLVRFPRNAAAIHARALERQTQSLLHQSHPTHPHSRCCTCTSRPSRARAVTTLLQSTAAAASTLASTAALQSQNSALENHSHGAIRSLRPSHRRSGSAYLLLRGRKASR
ncbi:hypothetical protein C8J57DRAFT_1624825 [Mycena rebaudengoi]|nr:hypothetical protein C8J57DRAFT_1624825 [Mycena rebaudengoi]